MTAQETLILETFSKTFPLMTEKEKERLLSFGEGMAFAHEMMHKNKISAEKEQKEGD